MESSLRKVLLILFLLIILNSSFVLAQETHNLNLDFELGDEYLLETTITQDINQNLMGMDVNLEQEMKLAYQFLVEEITSEGDYIISVKYTEFDLDMSDLEISNLNATQGIEESDSVDIQQELDYFKQNILDEQFEMKLSNQGDIVSIASYEVVTEEILAEIDDSEVEEHLSVFRNSDSLKESWQQVLAYLPREKVAVGDSWENSFEINEPIAMEVFNYYQLAEINEEKVRITLGDNNQANNIFITESLGEEIDFDFSGAQSGEVILNPSSNWIESLNLTQEISGYLNIMVNQQGQTLEVPTELTTELKVNGEKL